MKDVERFENLVGMDKASHDAIHVRHQCNRMTSRVWTICCQCCGRIHHPGCTTKLNKHRDCCAARHRMLHAQGQERGIDDPSLSMLEGVEFLK